MVRIHHRAAFERLYDSQDFWRLARLAAHFGAGRNVTAFFKSSGDSESDALRRLPLAPAESVGGGLQHGFEALVFQIAKPKLERLHRSSRRQLIHVDLTSEMI